jgi:hypothetical protein
VTAAAEPSPTPWSTGLALTAFAFAITVVTVVAFGSELARIHPVLAAVVNIVAAAGAVPTLWAWRLIPVYRWVAAGVGAGVPVAWLVLLVP